MPRVTKEEENISQFAQRLKLLRLQKGYSQKEVADQLHINITNYGNYERSDAMPSAETLSKLAEVFGVSVDYLLGGKNEDAAFVNLEDRDLLNLFNEVEKFPPQKKDMIKMLLTDLVQNQKMQQVMNKAG